MVVADPTRLRQIIINLVGNAIKFTPRGDVSLEVVSGVQYSGPGAAALLGAGYRHRHCSREAEDHFRSFLPGRWFHDAYLRRHGAGADHLPAAGDHDGRSDVGGERIGERQPLPLHGTGADGKGRGGDGAAGAMDLAGLPVLVVDDNLTNRRILGEMLRHWGMRPELAPSGAEAITMLQEADRRGVGFALLLVDAQMPGMDGFTLVQRLRQQTDLRKMTIMMLTSAGQRGDAARCRELGIAAYLVKPIVQSQFLDAVLNVLAATVRKRSPQREPEGLAAGRPSGPRLEGSDSFGYSSFFARSPATPAHPAGRRQCRQSGTGVPPPRKTRAQRRCGQ